MSNVAHSPPEQGQPISVRSRQWITNHVRPSTLPPPALKPAFSGPQHLLTLTSVEDDGLCEELQVIGEIESGARVIEKAALPEPTDFDPPDKLDAVRGCCFDRRLPARSTSCPGRGHRGGRRPCPPTSWGGGLSRRCDDTRAERTDAVRELPRPFADRPDIRIGVLGLNTL
jgi:hypothetical protein